MHILSSRKCTPAAIEALHSSEALSSVLGVSAWRHTLPAFFLSLSLSEVLFFLLKWLSSSPRFQQTSCIFIAIWRIPTGLNKGALVVKTAYRGDGLRVNSTHLTGCDLACVCMSWCLFMCMCMCVNVSMYFCLK